MTRQEDKYIDHAAEIDGSNQSDTTPDVKNTLQNPHAAHHHHYDPKCEQCRQAAEAEYRRKLASGEFNRIDVVD